MAYNDILIIGTLILMEWILSIDNAAVLATMVRHLPKDEQGKALKYGIIWAYLFRWIALLLAVYIVKFAIFKILWGAYLCWLTYSYFTKPHQEESSTATKVGRGFWSTVVLVEVMDMVFSIDNVLAAVALSPKLWVVMVGVAIGILAMRFAATSFITLMEKYPTLERSAYIVIGILGAKLIIPTVAELLWLHWIADVFHSHIMSAVTSIITFALFLYPIFKSKLTK